MIKSAGTIPTTLPSRGAAPFRRALFTVVKRHNLLEVEMPVSLITNKASSQTSKRFLYPYHLSHNGLELDDRFSLTF